MLFRSNRSVNILIWDMASVLFLNAILYWMKKQRTIPYSQIDLTTLYNSSETILKKKEKKGNVNCFVFGAIEWISKEERFENPPGLCERRCEIHRGQTVQESWVSHSNLTFPLLLSAPCLVRTLLNSLIDLHNVLSLASFDRKVTKIFKQLTSELF